MAGSTEPAGDEPPVSPDPGPGASAAAITPGIPEALGERLRALVREIPDFPRRGVIFRDITTLLRDADAFRLAIDALVEAHRHAGVEVVAGVESRGFVLGGAVAYLLGAGFVPVRKQGKLPHATISAAYALEYGEAVLEVHADAIRPGQRVLIVDDLLATGGTARATVDLVERLGGEIVGIAFLIELSDLAGLRPLGEHPHVSLIRF
jgi:adenine phosphoribosyltransferase